ncbi:serine/threonine-protein kinase [Bacillus thermophilus]|uniref:Serine/threonine-protein kinase n=2 Tax=Bacillaceae TaxID=186817 RepID=A0ABS2RAJ4_9BACI|nr:serine/threonine-protein kinase [Siminovitchia thermophila]
MMTNKSWTNRCNVLPGTVIRGKWHHNRYVIIKKLGSGANGIVYLAEGAGGYTAIKMSDDSMSIISEVNVLKELAKVQGSVLGPSLLDVDDWEQPREKSIPFYAMEYINGPNLLSFIRQKGTSWAGVMIVQLLHHLEQLHRLGWIFCDIKPENLIVSVNPAKIRCIDVGGTTRRGRAVKEFTEFFDRGYWGLGSRKAEPSYDLFSTAMVMINLFYPNRFQKNSGGIHQLRAYIQKSAELSRYQEILEKALTGQYASAEQMKKEMLSIMSRTAMKNRRVKQKRSRKKGSLMETAAVIFVTSFLYGLYIYLFLL